MKFNIGDEVEVISEIGGYSITRIGSRGVVTSVGVDRSIIKFSHISRTTSLQYIGHSWGIENRDLKLLINKQEKIINKIKEMQERRKALGYRF